MLSMQDDPRYVREAFAAGASGYVLKEAADAEVVDAVREVANGGAYVHPALGARLIAAEVEERAEAEEDPLSDREREVLRLLALGHTNQEIAKMLYLSVRTVETHRAHIMQKLRLDDPRGARALRDRPRPARRAASSGVRLFRRRIGGRATEVGELHRPIIGVHDEAYAVSWRMAKREAHSGGSSWVRAGSPSKARTARTRRDGRLRRPAQRVAVESLGSRPNLGPPDTRARTAHREPDPHRRASCHRGIISELAEHLASQLGEERVMSRAVVVLPLREGASEQAAELLRGGPPFDPEEVGLERHHVFLTEREAVFVFEADSRDAADELLTSAALLVGCLCLEGSRRRAAAARRRRLLLGPAARAGRPLVRAHARARRQ